MLGMENPEAEDMIQELTKIFAEVLGGSEREAASPAVTEEMTNAMIKYMPLRGIISFGNERLQEKGFLISSIR